MYTACIQQVYSMYTASIQEVYRNSYLINTYHFISILSLFIKYTCCILIFDTFSS